MSDLYDSDFYAWANQQAALLRSGRVAQADIANIAEEIESMGRSEKRELVSRLTVLLLHLLKWSFQPGLRGASWRGTIRVQRIQLEEHLQDNPSLKPRLPGAIIAAYRVSRIEAAAETRMPDDSYPAECPWSAEQIMDAAFWPE